jgi:hypothetical protein
VGGAAGNAGGAVKEGIEGGGLAREKGLGEGVLVGGGGQRHGDSRGGVLLGAWIIGYRDCWEGGWLDMLAARRKRGGREEGKD